MTGSDEDRVEVRLVSKPQYGAGSRRVCMLTLEVTRGRNVQAASVRLYERDLLRNLPSHVAALEDALGLRVEQGE